jgi:uncharacterized tellurite resistance protein B-like protein
MEGEWSYAHDLVNMYLGIAYLADHKLDPEEERTQGLYDTLGSDENRYALYLQSTLNVARLLEDSKDQLRCIIQDLVDIAAADGVLDDREATMIKASAIAYGLNIELSFDEDANRVRLSFGD